MGKGSLKLKISTQHDITITQIKSNEMRENLTKTFDKTFEGRLYIVSHGKVNYHNVLLYSVELYA